MKVAKVNLRGQEQGLGHVLLAVVIVVVLGVIGFAGYTVANRNSPKASTKTTTTTGSSEKAATDTGCVATYHDANLCKFASNANLDKLTYKATATVTGGDSAGQFTVESDGKGNSSVSTTGSGQTFNAITLDGNSYLQTGNVWYEYPKSSGDTSSSSDSNPASGVNLVLGSGITYKPEGTEACGSMTCFKYEVTDTSQADATQTVWFDNRQFLVRKWQEAATTDGQTTTTVLEVSYPGHITISKPSPVQVVGQ
jgi:hypothetical protein